MSTQFITMDSAHYISFAVPEAAGSTCGGVPPEKSPLGDSDFFKGKSISELAREQDVGPVKDIRVFAGVIPDDEDVDEMLAQLDAMRGSASDPDDAIRARLADVDRQEEKRRRLQAFLESETPEKPEGGGASLLACQHRRAERGWRRLGLKRSRAWHQVEQASRPHPHRLGSHRQRRGCP